MSDTAHFITLTKGTRRETEISLGHIGRALEELADQGSEPLTVVALTEEQLSELSAFHELVGLVETLTPNVRARVPGEAALRQARRNAELRHQLLTTYNFRTATDVAKLARSHAKNTSALAHRWRKENRIFGVEWNEWIFPDFQFGDDGKPKDMLIPLIDLFRKHAASDWEIFGWFASPNAWLDGKRPVELLDEEPQGVLVAAARTFESVG